MLEGVLHTFHLAAIVLQLTPVSSALSTVISRATRQLDASPGKLNAFLCKLYRSLGQFQSFPAQVFAFYGHFTASMAAAPRLVLASTMPLTLTARHGGATAISLGFSPIFRLSQSFLDAR